MSQENVSDKVKHLQKQIAQGIKFGQRPPSLRKSEGDEGSSEEEEVPRSPLQVLAQIEAEPQKQVSTPVKSPRSKQVLPPTGTIESVNLDAVPQSVPLLDNAAARHKLSVKPKNQRISRKHRRFTQEEERFRKQQEEAERKRKEEEDRRIREEEEELKREEAERRRQEEEEKKIREEEQRKQREEAERKKKEEERKIREELERQQHEEAEKRRNEEERMRKEEERKKQEEEEERRRKEEETRIQKQMERMTKLEEERRKQDREHQQKQEEERRRREEEARRQHELEVERKRKEEEERKQKEQEEKLRSEDLENMKMGEKEKMRKEEEQRKMSLEEDCGSLDTEERKRRAEELRWKEMEERQRPFSFKVSSGEKQILFQKVNLTPVTLASSLQTATVAGQGEGARTSPPEGPDPTNLPTSPYVPHTAILVTGAQLCGTAVNLDQIKDTACKSLLGLGEDRKTQGTPPMKSKTSPERRSGRTKSLTESALSTDKASAAVLAEWASIRSKIFKGVEDGKYDEYPDLQNRNPQPPSDEQLPFAHSNLRKTVSSSAKFSITPAKKKFGDINRNSELYGPDEKDALEEASGLDSPPASSPASTSKPPHRTSKTVRIVERGSEECMFAKDLPSFLVPSPGERPEGNELKSRLHSEPERSDSRDEGQERGRDAEDKPSPFGIKLRRTNYSLRFHSEQSTEKRKKRYSAGDSFDGVPSPLTPMEPDSYVSSVFSDKPSPTSPQKDRAACKFLHASSPAFPKGAKSASPAAHSEVLSKPPHYRRPPTSPKPSGGIPTPPPSPKPTAGHKASCDDVVQKHAGSSGLVQASRSEEPSTTGQLYRSSQGEEEPKEKRSFFPSINIPWREKADRKAELVKKKPSLQSRHSLDSPKVQDKEAGPLWITLALQKQKGFREQQQNREERRSQRESRLAEKQTRERESSPTDSKGSGSTSPSSKPQTPEELKRPDSLLGRFERREHLQKANTLPGSVTEIADSTPSPPAVKDLSKRFPSSDSPGVSTEPAWLALAKRKAKAWSDCPQIIK
uniref:Capping protein inhibiting regulator of actin dynamics n=1 Tax=Oryzias latipes TaxID=8090 RepID=A0A3P9IW17_ORYLA